MRRELLALLPAFAHLFGIRPWDIELLTSREIDTFTNYLRTVTDG